MMVNESISSHRKEPASKYFLSLPEDEGFFWNDNKSLSPSVPAVFILEMDSDDNIEGELSIIDSPEANQFLLSNFNWLTISKACDFKDRYIPSNKIKLIKKGKVSLSGNKLVIKEKIRLEASYDENWAQSSDLVNAIISQLNEQLQALRKENTIEYQSQKDYESRVNAISDQINKLCDNMQNNKDEGEKNSVMNEEIQKIKEMIKRVDINTSPTTSILPLDSSKLPSWLNKLCKKHHDVKAFIYWINQKAK